MFNQIIVSVYALVFAGAILVAGMVYEFIEERINDRITNK